MMSAGQRMGRDGIQGKSDWVGRARGTANLLLCLLLLLLLMMYCWLFVVDHVLMIVPATPFPALSDAQSCSSAWSLPSRGAECE